MLALKDENAIKHAAVNAAITELLTEKGPLTTYMVHYFIELKRSRGYEPLKIISNARECEDIVGYVIKYNQSEYFYQYGYVFLASNPDSEIVFEAPHNYMDAYYNLLDQLEAIKANPELLNVPESYLNKVLGWENPDE